MAGAATTSLAEKDWGEYVSVICQILAKRNTKMSKHELGVLKSFLFSFSQPNGFTQRKIGRHRWRQLFALLVISERKQMPYTLYNHNNLMDEVHNFRDKYLKEYRVKNTNMSMLKKVKWHGIVIQI